MSPAIFCVGGANIDSDFHLAEPFVPGTSNPAQVAYSMGGVALNVAETLGRLGCSVALVSSVGDDAFGWEVIDHIDAYGIDAQYIQTHRGASTSRYVAIHGPDGSYVVGVNAMDVVERIDATQLESVPLEDADWVFADCNLHPDALRYLIDRRRSSDGFRLAVDTVAVPKATRLPERLDGIDMLFANTDEANALLGLHLTEGVDEALRLARGLRQRGPTAVSVTIGELGGVLASPDGDWYVGVAPTRLVNTTGGGDARIAGTLFGLISGAPLPLAARHGALVSSLAIESVHSIHPSLSPQLVDGSAHRIAAIAMEGPLP